MNSSDFSSRRGGTELGKRYMTRLNWIPHITGIPVVCDVAHELSFLRAHFQGFPNCCRQRKENRKGKGGEEVMENAQCI